MLLFAVGACILGVFEVKNRNIYLATLYLYSYELRMMTEALKHHLVKTES